MSQITYYTKKQCEVEKWVQSLGIRTKLEEDIEQYRVDVGIFELDLAIEIDGPSHRKLPKEGKLITLDQERISKRDKLLLQYYPNGIYHVPVDISEEDFKSEFQKIINKVSNGFSS